MGDQRFWLCAEIRGARHEDYRGFGLLVDWDNREVVRRFDAPAWFDPTMPEGHAARECRGVRQVRLIEGKLHALTQGGLLVLDPESLDIVNQVSHPWHCGGHYVIQDQDGEHLWYNSAVPDAVVRLTKDGSVTQVIHLCDSPVLAEQLPIRRYRHDDTLDLRVITEDWIDQEKRGGRVDQLHINTLQAHCGALYAFSCTFGALIRVTPEPSVVFRDAALANPHDGQLLAGGRVVVNDSGNSRVIVYGPERHERVMEIDIPVPATRGADPEHAKRGYVRGFAQLDDSRILVGSAPLSLFEVDLERGEVIDQMTFSDDPAVTSHGICVAA